MWKRLTKRLSSRWKANGLEKKKKIISEIKNHKNLCVFHCVLKWNLFNVFLMHKKKEKKERENGSAKMAPKKEKRMSCLWAPVKSVNRLSIDIPHRIIQPFCWSKRKKKMLVVSCKNKIKKNFVENAKRDYSCLNHHFNIIAITAAFLFKFHFAFNKNFCYMLAYLHFPIFAHVRLKLFFFSPHRFFFFGFM